MISVMVKVPNDLSGASLLGVHNWVKGNIALSNPGASPDYTITDTNGNRMSLSDVSRSAGKDVSIEVVTVSGVKNNPAMNLTMIPSMDVKYPDMVRTGNNLTDLLPGEIDSAMATRVVAEQGLHRGLHLLNRMTLSTYNKSISSPTTAALLQMGEIIKSNPSDRTPFTQRTPLHYGSEKALQQWLVETAGADKKTISVANTEVEEAKIHAKYGLNTKDITTFAQDVLSDYLFAASSNRGLIRTLVRHIPELTDRNNAAASRQLIQKLSYMFPTQPQSFYDGTQRVFVARTAFMYPAYAESLLSRRQMNTIVNFARDYPRNMGTRDEVPRGMKGLVATMRTSPFRDFRAYVSRIITRAADANDSTNWLDDQYRAEGHLATVIKALARDPREYLNDRGFRQLCYYSDLGGFYPSPPPKWPRKLMYAIMDGFLLNLPHIIDMKDPSKANLTPVQMAYFAEKAKASDDISVKRLKGGDRKIKLSEIKVIEELLAKKPESEEAFEAFYNNASIQRMINGEKIDRKTDAAKALIRANIERALEEHAAKTSTLEYTSELTFDAAGPKSVLEMVYDIAEIASTKYDYNMRGDDFKFTMAMVHYSFKALAETTAGSAFTLARDRIDKGLANIMGANKFQRLEELRQSINAREFEERPRAAMIQSTILAQLLVIRDEISAELSAPTTTVGREEVKERMRVQYRALVQRLNNTPLSPSLGFATQSVLADIRSDIEGSA